MENTRTYQKNDIICLKGDPGSHMFCILEGKASVFNDYGKPEEKKLSDLGEGALFGEMSLLDHEPRSATVVAAADETKVLMIDEESFQSFFETSPEIILDLARQMSQRLRQKTKDYVEACRTVHDAVEAEKKGEEKSEGLLSRIKKLCTAYLDSLRS